MARAPRKGFIGVWLVKDNDTTIYDKLMKALQEDSSLDISTLVREGLALRLEQLEKGKKK